MKFILAHQTARDRAKEAPAMRCPEFDEECADVLDHAHCSAGSVVVVSGELCITPPIDGFCPYVCGMMKKAD